MWRVHLARVPRTGPSYGRVIPSQGDVVRPPRAAVRSDPVSRTSSVVIVCVLLAVVVALAGCGGSGSSSNSAGTTTKSHLTTTTKSPAAAILKSLGLEECFNHQLPATAVLDTHSTAISSSFAGAQIFEAAADCSKKGPRTTVIMETYSTHEGIAAGKAALKTKHPKAGVASFKTIVIGVIGGANPQQTANKIIKQLSGPVVTG